MKNQEKVPREKAATSSPPSRTATGSTLKRVPPSQSQARAQGPRDPPPRARASYPRPEKEDPREQGFTHPREQNFTHPCGRKVRAGMWMSVQQGQCRVPPGGPSRILGKVQGRGPPKVGPGEELPHHGGSSLPGFGSRKGTRARRKREQRVSRAARLYYRKKERR